MEFRPIRSLGRSIRLPIALLVAVTLAPGADSSLIENGRPPCGITPRRHPGWLRAVAVRTAVSDECGRQGVFPEACRVDMRGSPFVRGRYTSGPFHGSPSRNA
ncbi:hypothetical protein V1506DRAFT_543068 [Lipomyces tetrasporus]